MAKLKPVTFDKVFEEEKRAYQKKLYAKEARQILGNVPKPRPVPQRSVEEGLGLKGIGNELRSIQRQVRRSSPQQVRIQPRPEPRQERRNFFEHHDEQDVYGDEGLTFFDSTKARGGRTTGSLFGIN